METQFSQSGQFQKENFSSFIKELVQKFKPEQIYSFGKNIDFKVNNGCFIENHSTDNYHYFLVDGDRKRYQNRTRSTRLCQ